MAFLMGGILFAGFPTSIVGDNLWAVTSVRLNGAPIDFTIHSNTMITILPPGDFIAGPFTPEMPNGAAITVESPFGSYTMVHGFSAGLILHDRVFRGSPGDEFMVPGWNIQDVVSVTFGDRPATFSLKTPPPEMGHSLVLSVVVPDGATSGPIYISTPLQTVTATYISPVPLLRNLCVEFKPASSGVSDERITCVFSVRNCTIETLHGVVFQSKIPIHATLEKASSSLRYGYHYIMEGAVNYLLESLSPGEEAQITMTIKAMWPGQVVISGSARSHQPLMTPRNHDSGVFHISRNPDGPVLRIEPADSGAITLSWKAEPETLRLRNSSSPFGPWLDAGASPVADGAMRTVRLPATALAAYFRLATERE